MKILDGVSKVLSGVNVYAPLAAVAVARVQNEIGSSGGNPGVQSTKFQTAVGYVLAAAHAGEQVPVAKVQQIGQAIELAVMIAKMFGLGGKTAGSVTTIAVPLAPVAPPVNSPLGPVS